MLKRLKTITLIINAKAIVIAGLAVLSTFLCLSLEISANFPLTLLATAIVFPIVLSINNAYKRREAALDSIQEHLENPFDQIGQDDVSINAEKFVERLQAGATSQAA